MILVRTLREAAGFSEPRVESLEMPEPELYFREREEYRLHQPATDHPLAVGMPNVHYDPKPTPPHDFPAPDHGGLRIWDRRLGCYVRMPRPEPAPMRRPKATPTVWGETSGPYFWVMCAETGQRMARFRASDSSRAATVAGLWAIAHGLPAAAARAEREI